jgi:hypothetical protein
MRAVLPAETRHQTYFGLPLEHVLPPRITVSFRIIGVGRLFGKTRQPQSSHVSSKVVWVGVWRLGGKATDRELWVDL